jgi:hypothetical protein
MGKKRKEYRVLVGKTEGRRPFGRPSRRWKYSIKIYLKQVRWRAMDSFDVAEDRERWGGINKKLCSTEIFSSN